MTKAHGKVFNGIMIAVIVLCLVVGIVGNVLAFGTYRVSLNNFFTTFESSEAGETTQDDWFSVAAEIEAEGLVLLKNKNNTLPLSGISTVNLLGYRSYNHVYSGTGSGATDSSNAVTLEAGLKANGVINNPALEANGLYTTAFNNDTEGMGLFGRFMGAGYDLTMETPVSGFTSETSFESLKAYSDVAIVTLGRVGGEGSDLTAAPAEKMDGAETFLALSNTEKELLETARETFGTLIVIVNSGNAMELGCLEDYDVDAAIWCGDVGCRGMQSVADALVGKVNPSGRLPDTYAYSATSAPSYNNFGDYTFSNADAKYVNYAEGIYVGYRWYETADAEGFFDSVSNEYGTGYNGVVQFPFGYGLSYTAFNESITGGTANGSAISAGQELSIEVTVQNAGALAGKDVVELYYTAPYTNGGLEKSAVDLLTFEKTSEIPANGSETVTLKFNADDLASYDSSADGGKGAYVLEKGEYVISVRRDAHTVIDSITLNVANDIVYSSSGAGARKTDNQIAVNQFNGSDNGIATLSRANGFSNYDAVMSQKGDIAGAAVLSTINNPTAYDPSYDSAVTDKYTVGVDYRAEGAYSKRNGDLTLADMAGLGYDDPQWDKLLSQMSISDMKKLIGEGGWSTAEIESVGKSLETHIDSSNGLVRVVGSTPILGTAYPSSVVQAATWNRALIEKFAQYYSDEANAYGVSGLYCPSLNIHRSPFGGRNYEYYSEDGVLSGEIAKSFVAGADSRGVITYMKHFALNEQETNREGVFTFATEQAIREIYLKGFELIVKTGKESALMTSMNNIGPLSSVTNEGLLTEVLRNEWGFTGFALTDALEGSRYRSAVEFGLRAGHDMWLSPAQVEMKIESDADIYYARRAVKNILYSEANASVIAASVKPWQYYVYAIDVVLLAIAAVCCWQLVKNLKKQKAAK